MEKEWHGQICEWGEYLRCCFLLPLARRIFVLGDAGSYAESSQTWPAASPVRGRFDGISTNPPGQLFADDFSPAAPIRGQSALGCSIRRWTVLPARCEVDEYFEVTATPHHE